jgi:hypothetical protein
MTSHNPSKINQLIKAWPRGTVAVQAWLQKQGVYRQLAESYHQGSWLERIGYGAYIQSGDTVDWTGGLYALQAELGMRMHVAALTALEITGSAHFIPLGKGHPIWIFKDTSETRAIPGWLQNRFGADTTIKVVTRKLFESDWMLGLTEKEIGEYKIYLSSPERAMMEYLDLVPQQQSFDQALLLMEGLQTLRPKLLQALLEACSSIKVKRLFMYMAEHEGHSWVAKLDVSRIDFGKGKRIIGQGGKFNNKYNLSLPIMATDEEDTSDDQSR